MKKLLLVLSVCTVFALAASTVMATTQWNFGASLRYGTFWTERDGGKEKINDLAGGGAALSSDGTLDWSTQGNSQIRMFMKSDSLEGYIEMGYDFDDNKVWTREFWGKYRFNDKLAITIGQQKQLFNSYISNQVWNQDMGMNGIGTNFAKATPKITLSYGGFSFAMAKPYDDRKDDLMNTSTARVVNAWGTNPSTYAYMHTDADTYMPELQAAYEYMADTWRIKLAGAFASMRYNKNSFTYDNGAGRVTSLKLKSRTVNSWLVGLDGDISFGPLYLGVAASVGQNWADAGWNNGDNGLSKKAFGMDYLTTFGAAPKMNVGAWGNGWSYSWKDTTSVMAAFVGGYRLTEALRFELGAGYRYDDNDAFMHDSNIWNVYLQASYQVAPGFSITPEVGYIDLDKNVWSGKDQGYLWYAGAKWQMDF